MDSVPEKIFKPTKVEIFGAIFSFPLAFLYTYVIIPPTYGIAADTLGTRRIFITAFTVIFFASSVMFYRKQKASKESFIWLGCTAVIVASMLLGRNQVWGDAIALFFIHCFAVYWLMNRSGRMIEGGSGPFSPLDMLNGFVILPFKNFFLRIRVLLAAITSRLKKGANKGAKLGAIIAVLVGIVLFYVAAALLSSADETFNRIIEGFLDFVRFDLSGEFILRLLLSLPVGAYLFGLIAGASREDPYALMNKRNLILKRVDELKKVPVKVWTIIIVAFSILYLLYFVIQGSYLFGAFTRTLPEGFTVAQYARQGFFELCLIMGINFLLLWIVIKSSSEDIRHNRPAMIMCSILIVESLLFSVTAFSKLMLYISCFGFTPRRLQSTWLIVVLFCGSALTLYSLWTKKRSFRTWIFISGISLALLHLY